MDCPPNANLRSFNVNDILGDLDHDNEGNPITLEAENGQFTDRAGKQTNQKGYLVDKDGDVIENLNGNKMF